MKMDKNKIVIEEDPINSLVEIEDTTNYEIKSNDSGNLICSTPPSCAVTWT